MALPFTPATLFPSGIQDPQGGFLRPPRFRVRSPTKGLWATGPGPDGLAGRAIYSPA